MWILDHIVDSEFILDVSKMKGLLDFLLKKGLVGSFLHKQSTNLRYEGTFLERAVQNDRFDFLEVMHQMPFLSRWIGCYEDNQGRTLLHFACQEGSLVIVKWFVGAGYRDLLFYRDRAEQTPLDLAFQFSEIEILHYFFEDFYELISVDDPMSMRDSLDKVKKCFSDTKEFSRMCLHYHIVSGNTEVVFFLLNNFLEEGDLLKGVPYPGDAFFDEMMRKNSEKGLVFTREVSFRWGRSQGKSLVFSLSKEGSVETDAR